MICVHHYLEIELNHNFILNITLQQNFTRSYEAAKHKMFEPNSYLHMLTMYYMPLAPVSKIPKLGHGTEGYIGV